MDNKKRLDWIDVARGIGIILVVFCHIYFDYTRTYIYSFLMPLFFFISGFFFSPQKFSTLKSLISNRSKTLLYPYFLWSIVLFLFWLFFDSVGSSKLNNAIGIFYASGGKDFMEWGIMLWFLPCLFLTEVLYYTIYRQSRLKNSIWVIVIVLLGYFITSHGFNNIPWSFNISLIMILFFHIGHELRYFLQGKIFNVLHYLWLFPSVFIWLIASYYNGEIYTYKGQFNNPLLYLLSGVSGTASILLISHYIRNFKLLSLIGKNTLFIFIAHLRAFTVFKLLQLYIFNIPITNSLVYSISYALLAVILLVPISIFVKRKFPYLLQFPK